MYHLLSNLSIIDIIFITFKYKHKINDYIDNNQYLTV